MFASASIIFITMTSVILLIEKLFRLCKPNIYQHFKVAYIGENDSYKKEE